MTVDSSISPKAMKPGCSVAAIEVASMFQAFLPLLQMCLYAAIDRTLLSRAPSYTKFTPDQRRCTVIYIMELIVTTVSLGFLCAASNVFYADVPTEYDVRMILSCFNLLNSLYLFEVIFRPDMRWSLRIHHLVVISFVYFVSWALEDDYSIHIVRALVIEGFTALTEQTTFLGMVMYRFKHHNSGIVLKFSAVQTLLFKVVLIAAMLYYVFLTESALWYFIGLSCTVMLFPTQVYGAWAVWQVGLRADKRERSNDKAGGDMELRSEGQGGRRHAVPTHSPAPSPCASPDVRSRVESSSTLFDEEGGPPPLSLVPGPRQAASPPPLRKQAMLKSMPSTRMV